MSVEKNRTKRINPLERFAIKLGLFTEQEIADRKKQGIPWNRKPKK